MKNNLNLPPTHTHSKVIYHQPATKPELTGFPGLYSDTTLCIHSFPDECLQMNANLNVTDVPVCMKKRLSKWFPASSTPGWYIENHLEINYLGKI